MLTTVIEKKVREIEQKEQFYIMTNKKDSGHKKRQRSKEKQK